MGRDDGRIRSLPLAGGWTATRDMPAPSGPTFKERWAKQRH
jgi:L-lactate dehydrogenase complex protein LldF